MSAVSPREVEKHLKGVRYPAKKEDLVNQARKEGASQDIIDALQKMPSQTFNASTDVTKAMAEGDRTSKPRS